jgi:hypothetical protein
MPADNCLPADYFCLLVSITVLTASPLACESDRFQLFNLVKCKDCPSNQYTTIQQWVPLLHQLALVDSMGNTPPQSRPGKRLTLFQNILHHLQSYPVLTKLVQVEHLMANHAALSPQVRRTSKQN